MKLKESSGYSAKEFIKGLIAFVIISLFAVSCGGGDSGSGTSQNSEPPIEEELVTVSVKCSAIQGAFRNLAGGVNIRKAPENSTETAGVLPRFFNEVGSDQFFRTKAFTGFVNQSLDNYFIIEGVDDSPNLKAASDLIHASGGKVMLQIWGVPRWLSTCDFVNNPDCDRVISIAPEYAKYPPSDYEAWRTLVAGLIEKLAELGIQIDYFEIHGEPSIGTTWWGDGDPKAIPSFNEHYKQTVQAIRSINPEAKVGGAAFNSSHIPLDLNSTNQLAVWIKEFVDFVANNNVPLDLFTWHAYTPRTEIYRWDAQTIRNYLAGKGLGNIPIFLTEWGVEGSGKNLRDKASTHFGASFAASALMEISSGAADGQNFFTLLDGYARFGLFDANFLPKPAYNAFRFFATLNGDRIEATSDDPPYKLLLRDTEIEQKDIRVLSTRDSEGISAIVAYYIPVAPEDDPTYDLSRKIKINIRDIPFAQYTYRLYLIDRDHSNGFFGSNPEMEMIEEGQGAGDFQKIMEMPVYGTVMVRIIK